MADFGVWLQQQMDREDLNMLGLATLLGLAHTSVRDWMIGKSAPSKTNIRRLARALHVETTDVYHALGLIPEPSDWPLVIRRIATDLQYLRPEDVAIVESLVRSFAAREQLPKQGANNNEAVPE